MVHVKKLRKIVTKFVTVMRRKLQTLFCGQGVYV